MTTISWRMSRQIKKNFEAGLRMRCFENISITAEKWKEILDKLGIPNSPVKDPDFDKWLWKHPQKELELKADKIPDEKHPITVVDFYGMKDDFDTFLKITGFGEKK